MVHMLRAALFACLALAAQGAMAADPVQSGGYCLRLTPSPLLETQDVATISKQVDEWYAQALEVSQTARTVDSQRPAYVWANEAKAYCGMAKGFLSAGEVDAETISKCDCFSGRMTYFLP